MNTTLKALFPLPNVKEESTTASRKPKPLSTSKIRQKQGCCSSRPMLGCDTLDEITIVRANARTHFKSIHFLVARWIVKFEAHRSACEFLQENEDQIPLLWLFGSRSNSWREPNVVRPTFGSSRRHTGHHWKDASFLMFRLCPGVIGHQTYLHAWIYSPVVQLVQGLDARRDSSRRHYHKKPDLKRNHINKSYYAL